MVSGASTALNKGPEAEWIRKKNLLGLPLCKKVRGPWFG